MFLKTLCWVANAITETTTAQAVSYCSTLYVIFTLHVRYGMVWPFFVPVGESRRRRRRRASPPTIPRWPLELLRGKIIWSPSGSCGINYTPTAQHVTARHITSQHGGFGGGL